MIQFFYPEVNGPINQAFFVSLYLKQYNNIESQINTTYYGAKTELPKEEIFDGIRVNRYYPWFNLMFYVFCPAIFTGLKQFDILHCHEARSFPVHFGWLTARLYNKPLVVSTHGSLCSYKHLVSKWYYLLPYQIQEIVFLKLAIKMADRVVVSSVQEQEEAINFGIDPKKVRVIPMGIDVNRYRRKKETNSNKPLQLLCVGRISRHRYLEPVLQAIARTKDVSLLIIGNEALISGTTKYGYSQELRDLAGALGISDRVIFRPACYDEELIDHYNNADAFVLTSQYESFGQPLLEAAAAGLPIITTPTGVAKEIIKDGQTGYLVNAKPSEIKDRIEKLKDGSTRKYMGDNIRILISQDFNWKKIIQAYKNMYEELLR